MNSKILALFFATAAASAWGGEELTPNIAVDIRAPGAVHAEIEVTLGSREEVRRFDLKQGEDGLVGGIALAPGKPSLVRITAFGAEGKQLYAGESYLEVGKELTPQVDIALEGRETRGVAAAKFGTYRLGLKLAAGPGEQSLLVQATLFDATGRHLPVKPDDFSWRGWPEKFEPLPYSCFRDSLCIELPDPGKYRDLIACMRDVVCSHTDPPDTRGPYRHVVTGRNHSCALTMDDEIRCWGDNRYGQLRASPSLCPMSISPWPSGCSPVPIPIQCGAGEICKFKSLAAGGERTCAVDTTGRLWCWGSAPDVSGEPVSLSYRDLFNGEVEAFTANGTKVTFVSVDIDLRHSCALASSGALYCWEFNRSTLDDGNVHSPGTSYRSVSTGKRHSCAQQSSGKFECWGDNYDGQLTGTHTGSSTSVHPGLQEILTRGGHRPAAGSTSTCAQDPDDNTICWGSPSHNVASGNGTGGWTALRHSYATSLASNSDTCQVSGNSFACTRICATGLGGDLYCGNWKFWAPPVELPEVPDPVSDHVVSWTQTDVGPNHVCALTTQREIWCFGTNAFGQLGTGAFSVARTDVPTTPVIR